MGNSKEFPCIGGALAGRYLTVHRNDSAKDRELVLFEVVAIGGNFRVVHAWGLSVVFPGDFCFLISKWPLTNQP